ncbi:uncharacterized protein [Magallana gigas]|uniref:uncharacterized protein n=1 Tax=Magallana gigas TaxID=29159 RepID=UPI00333F76F8
MEQSTQETIEQYITRLRQRAETCEFGNRDAIDERIRDQIIDKCVRHNLRRKLLEKGRELTIDQVREIARAMKDSERQATSIENQPQGASSNVVNKVSVQNKRRFVKKTNSKCYSCGYEGHLRNDPRCPAKGKKCRKCNEVGHFERQCKTKNWSAQGKHGRVHNITEQPDQGDEDKPYAFSVRNSVLDDGLAVNVGGVDLTDKQLFAYGGQEPLKVAGIFTATVKYNQTVIPDVEFVVIDGKGQALLGRDTALQLGVLQIVRSVSNAVNADNRSVFDKYPQCFNGVGKLKSFQLEIPIDPDVEPVIQPMRRIPYSLRDKLANKLDELLDLDIIERVEEPCSWVSPVVCVPKRSGDDIRLCVDMRQANTAVKRKVMQQVLQGCEGVHNIMDDIIVHASSQVEHDRCLENVVKVLYEKGFTLNRDKCQLNMSQVVFMGHVQSGRGIGPAVVKVKAVVDAREPKTSAEVRSFLGLVNYSSRFIPDLATVAAPLRELTRKNAIFRWGKSEQEAFDELKRRLADAEPLGYYDKSAPTKVIADASPVGLGAVLVQERNCEFRVISYASRSLSDTEHRYSQTEKEALALVWACERFHVYLYGIEFELLTDHEPLECIYSPKSKVCARIERWVLRMQPYNFKVRYIPGPKNIADTLSRLVKNDIPQKSHDIVDDYVRFVAVEATPIAMTTRDIERASEDDPELCSVRQCLVNQQWHRIEFKQFLTIRSELCSIGKLVLRDDRKHLEDKKKPGELKFTFKDASVASCSSKSDLPRPTSQSTSRKTTVSSDLDSVLQLSPATPVNSTEASCPSRPLARPSNVRQTPKKKTVSSDSDSSTQLPPTTPLNSTDSDSVTGQLQLASPLDSTGTISSESDIESTGNEFLSRKSSSKSRDREKFVRLSKEVDELKSEVKKLMRRVRSLEKKNETGDPSKNSTDDEVLDIPHAGPINLSELTSSCKKFTKAPDAVAFLLNSLFSKNEIKNSSISGKRTIKCRQEGPRPPIDQARFRVLERIIFETFPDFTRKDIREKIQNLQKVERKR